MKQIRGVFFVLLALGVFVTIGAIRNSARGDGAEHRSVEPISESIHITAADGVKSLARLIREQSAITIPDRPVALTQFTIDAGHGPLIFPQNDFQPQGFEFAIRAGDDKALKFPRFPINAPEALDAFLVKTESVSNFILYVEFYPK